MRFEISMPQLGQYGRVVMDGRDISGSLTGISIGARVGELTTINLEVVAQSVEFVGDTSEGRARITLGGKLYSLVEITDPVGAAQPLADEPIRCAEHDCEHPEDKRQEIRGMGGVATQILCIKCGCDVKEA